MRTKTARLSALVASLAWAALSSCNRANTHEFEVSYEQKPVRVTAQACDQSVEGTVGPTASEGAFALRCSGSLLVKVIYPDHEVTCQIGYIDRGEDPKRWRFSVEGRQCKPAGEKKLAA